MNIVNTPAPISIDDLKKYFTDNTTFYQIDYASSSLKGNRLLVYLGNLNIPCDISTEVNDEFLELLKDYFHSRILVDIPILEFAALQIILTKRFGKPESIRGAVLTNDQAEQFISQNEEIINHWLQVLDSLSLYNMQIVECQEFKDFVDTFPKNDTEDLTGINFVQLLGHAALYMIYGKVDESKLTNYTKYFSEYMFKGKNLYYYWANENNPMFLLTLGIASGELVNDKEIVVAGNE